MVHMPIKSLGLGKLALEDFLAMQRSWSGSKKARHAIGGLLRGIIGSLDFNAEVIDVRGMLLGKLHKWGQCVGDEFIILIH